MDHIRIPRARAWLTASHPGPAAVVTTIAALLALGYGRGVPTAVTVALAVLAGQLSIGWHNDSLDAARDRAAGRADKPLATGLISARGVRLAACLSAAACVPLSLASGLPGGSLHVLAVASAWSYNAYFKHTPLSVLPFLFSFGLLPAFAAGGLPATPWWTVAAGALLGGGAHFANVLPDLADDAATGVRGLPHRLGRVGSELAASGALLAATGLLAAGTGRAYAFAALALAAAAIPAGLWLGRTRDGRFVFRMVMALAVLDVVLLVAGSA